MLNKIKMITRNTFVRLLKLLGFSFSNNVEQCLYPIDIPDISIQSGLDFLLLELPPRYMPMMPNGLGYVHNILNNMGINFQTFDSNIILYHRFHSTRILENGPLPSTSTGIKMEDPWDNTNTDFWSDEKVLGFFKPFITEIVDKILSAAPKILGISLNGNNRSLAKRLVRSIKESNPDIIIIVGGYDCVYHDIAPHLFSDFDYMVIKEAELTLSPLVKKLLANEKPFDIPGVLSKYDSKNREWTGVPLLQDLDQSDFPHYEWTDTTLYQSFSRKHLIPIVASRGCNWGKCRFCAECFEFRKRSPKKVVDEIEFMYAKGFHTFHFNESDVNGDPENLYKICEEIIKRKLVLQLMGQLRIHKKNTKEYMHHLAKAGFCHLRFGVDGWSDSTLRLLNKGYNMKMAFENLKNSKQAGIYTTVNVVIGEPGETEEDIDEIIKNIIACKDSVDLVESLNTLILAAGAEYYMNPDKYRIKFRGDRREIYEQYPHYVPTDLWFSEKPYIDQDVRLDRLDRICKCLFDANVNIGAFASQRVKLLKKDANPLYEKK